MVGCTTNVVTSAVVSTAAEAAGMRGGRAVTERLTFGVARLADVGIDDLLAGRFIPAGTCPHCGKRTTDDFADEGTIVE